MELQDRKEKVKPDREGAKGDIKAAQQVSRGKLR